MAEESVGSYGPIVSVRRGRNQLPDEDRALQEARRRLHQREHGEGGEGGGSEGGSGSGSGSGSSHGDIRDDVSILGIPKEELTDNVRNAIDILLEEIQHLRLDLMHARSHEAYLEEQAEKDRLLHVMRRRAFLARVSLAARHVEEEHVQYGFIYIAVTNAGRLRTDFGHGAVESLLMQASEVVREQVEAGDVVGSLEQFDFGILLPGTPRGQTEAKAQAVMDALAGRTFIWQGQSLGIQASFGVSEVQANDGSEEVIDRAKRDLSERKAAQTAAGPSA